MYPRLLLCIAILLFLALSAACGPAPAATAQPLQPTDATLAATSSGAASAAVFQVVKPDGSTVAFTLDDLKQLPLTTVVADGSPQEGPTLLAVIEAAGVTEFAEVPLTGVDGSKTLMRDEVTVEVVLDFNNRAVSNWFRQPCRVMSASGTSR